MSQRYEQGGVWYDVPTPRPLRVQVRAIFLNALAYTGGNQKRAAKLLKISERAMSYQLTALDIPSAGTGHPGRPRTGQD
jgi:DNA-binding NtrC family response regulator